MYGTNFILCEATDVSIHRIKGITRIWTIFNRTKTVVRGKKDLL